ncbi:acyl carrier protein phosphodiesterase [Lentiprolixibacter aurantiacus]|uniref:Acyl carrier protein phosphodiesterase n=1 Tax=Lentiprolixibacter aurantiacus TaxID=2993939 RepID=A0AAE3MLR1_9FLAO|nr:acyl carrier protein phosphodiesterase [Lentiprolixibacter aurantiacus]MCX2719676.1 acyl carrier protein phosphodiesterase [Lentiprolixibacter aurantiacus]
MNFLAHIYLSFGDDEVSIGNFIADSIRSQQFTHLPDRIQKGIQLHRAIDTYTDSHKLHKQSSKRLYPTYSHYSRVIIDIFYDHFLAKNWLQYSDTPLEVYVDDFYSLLERNYRLLPRGVQRMMPYMITDNWLLNYSNIEGISKVLDGMNRRTQNKSKMNLAIFELESYYLDFEDDFTLFFDDLIFFSKKKYAMLCED